MLRNGLFKPWVNKIAGVDAVLDQVGGSAEFRRFNMLLSSWKATCAI